MSKIDTEKVKVPISPMIDIIFLMIFFFVINSMLETSINENIDLVKVEHCKPSQPEAQKIYLSISKDGLVQIGGVQVVNNDQLAPSINRIINTWGNSTKFIIRADKDTLHADIDGTLSKLKKSGAHNIVMSGEIASK